MGCKEGEYIYETGLWKQSTLEENYAFSDLSNLCENIDVKFANKIYLSQVRF